MNPSMNYSLIQSLLRSPSESNQSPNARGYEGHFIFKLSHASILQVVCSFVWLFPLLGRFFYLMQSILLMFVFIALACSIKHQKIIAKVSVKKAFPYVPFYFYSFWSCMYIFYPFDLFFVYSEKQWFNCILLHVLIQFFQHHLLMGLPIPPLNSLGALVKNQLTMCLGLFLYFLFCSTGLCLVLCQSHSF